MCICVNTYVRACVCFNVHGARCWVPCIWSYKLHNWSHQLQAPGCVGNWTPVLCKNTLNHWAIPLTCILFLIINLFTACGGRPWPWQSCDSQRPACDSHFSLSTVWLPELKFRSLGLAAKSLYPPSHLASPTPALLIILRLRGNFSKTVAGFSQRHDEIVSGLWPRSFHDVLSDCSRMVSGVHRRLVLFQAD